MATIREYRSSDMPMLRQLVYQLHETLRPFDEYLAPAAEIIDAYFHYLIDVSGRTHGTFLIAEERGEMVGYLCLFGRVAPEEPDQYPEEYSAVADVFVRPDCQHRGIGAALMQHAEDYARRGGARKIELNVLAENRDAISFYRRLGYQERIRVFTKKL